MPIHIDQHPDHVEKLRQRVARLQALYQRHIAIDDREVFPIAARVLHRAQIEELGREMAARRHARLHLPDKG